MGCGCGGSKAASRRAGTREAGPAAEGYFWRGPKREQSGPPPRAARPKPAAAKS